MATIKEIAQKAQVSISTVSRVLNCDESISVSTATKKRIFEIAEELEYRGKKQKKRKKHLSLLLINCYSLEGEVNDPYYISVRVAIERRAAQLGHRLTSASRGDALHFAGLDGIICLGAFSKEEAAEIGASGKPVVFVDSSPDYMKYDSICFDLGRETRRILEYLWKLGHRKIGFIGGSEEERTGPLECSDRRTLEYRQFMEEMGCYRKEYERIGSFTSHAGFCLMNELMALPDPPTAVFVANDSLAVGSLNAVSRAGKRCPEDFSVVGFNDIPTAKYMLPPLTTMHFYMDFMGEKAVDLISDRIITKRELPMEIILPARLMIRESVRDLRNAPDVSSL